MVKKIKKSIFNQLRKIAYDHAGIAIPENKMVLVSTRIQKRLDALGLDSPEQYLKYLEKNEDEIIYFLNVISTNYTYFFREEEHFNYLKSLIKRIYDNGKRRIRIWCGAASTGEEPYSIVMTVLETLNFNIKNVDFKLLATDISTRALIIGKQGVYSEDRVEQVPKNYLKKYFEYHKKDGEISYSVKDFVKKYVVFKRLNLAETPYPMKGPLDAIFIRNVMIYFDNKMRQNLVYELERLISPNGLVFIGHAETLSHLDTSLKALVPSVYKLKMEDHA